MNPPINRENLRDALIAVAICGVLAFAFNDCATVRPPKQQQPAMAAPGHSSTLMAPQQYQASQQSPMQNIADTTNSANSVRGPS
jgi:hypothetical protein